METKEVDKEVKVETVEEVEGIVDGVKGAVKWIKDTFNSIVSFFSGIISKILGFFKSLGTKVGDASASYTPSASIDA